MSNSRIHIQNNSQYYAEKAEAFFAEGYNCSQAVLLAFSEELRLPFTTAARLASSFGGGMGRLREVCGAVSGMFMVAGICSGYDDPKAQRDKAAHYGHIQELAAAFRAENGSIICRELLELQQIGPSDPTPELRTTAYYKKRPCKALVGDAARIIAEDLIVKQQLHRSVE